MGLEGPGAAVCGKRKRKGHSRKAGDGAGFLRTWKGNEGLCFGHVREEPPIRHSDRNARLVVTYRNLEFRAEL